MAGCVLRVSGCTEKIKTILALQHIQPCMVFWAGEPRFPGSRKVSTVSGFNLALSVAPDDTLDEQLRQATLFMQAKRQCLLAMMAIGVEGATVDFGLPISLGEDVPFLSYVIPPSFITLAAELGLGVEISLYGGAD
ncbi:hypothetical protein ACTSKR_12865 [Chitinibacteraceae bacterium HSL-7]